MKIINRSAYQVEHTDTFGGEANYCWVRRYEINARGKTPKGERLSLVRQAKALCGLSGVRADTIDYGDMIEIRPKDVAQVIFVTWTDPAVIISGDAAKQVQP